MMDRPERRGRRPGGSEISFAIDPSLDLDRWQEVFRAKRRLHITELLGPAVAESLYHAVSGEVAWSTYLTAHGRRYEAPYRVQRDYDDEQAGALLEMAHRSARDTGFGYAYEARSLPAGADAPDEASLLDRFAAFVRSAEVTGALRRICALDHIARIELEAVRLRPGHFMTFHATLPAGDQDGACAAVFSYHVTPEWRPEWGGLLELRGEHGHLVEAYAPCFNCLDLFAVPQGRWLSAVAPIAAAPAYSISGRVYPR